MAGSDLSESGSRTPPYPGTGIDGIPSIGDLEASQATNDSEVGVGLLFAEPSSSGGQTSKQPRATTSRNAARVQVPDPYGPSADSDSEAEADLDQVAAVRRSLLKPQASNPREGRGKKGWMAYQSVFPSSSSSEASDSDKETEDGSDDQGRTGIMGQSRRNPVTRKDPPAAPQPVRDTLDEPLLGPDEVAQMTMRVPVRLQVYHGRFGHWEREGLRKYKGGLISGVYG